MGIAQAMLNNPLVLVLNELTAELDPKERTQLDGTKELPRVQCGGGPWYIGLLKELIQLKGRLDS